MTDNNASLSPASSLAGQSEPARGTGQLGRHSNLLSAERAGGGQPAPGLGLCPAHRSPVNMPAVRGPALFISGDEINASLANYGHNVGQTANVYGRTPGDFRHARKSLGIADCTVPTRWVLDRPHRCGLGLAPSFGGSWARRSPTATAVTPWRSRRGIGFRVGFRTTTRPRWTNHTAPVVAENQLWARSASSPPPIWTMMRTLPSLWVQTYQVI